MYKVEIKEQSRDFTPREKVKIKDKGNAIKLDGLIQDGKLVLEIVDYAVLLIHNDNAEDTEYTNYMLVDVSGAKYVTGSPSFWEAFFPIWEELSGEINRENGEGIPYEIYKLDSRKREGKTFLTCSLAY